MVYMLQIFYIKLSSCVLVILLGYKIYAWLLNVKLFGMFVSETIELSGNGQVLHKHIFKSGVSSYEEAHGATVCDTYRLQMAL